MSDTKKINGNVGMKSKPSLNSMEPAINPVASLHSV